MVLLKSIGRGLFCFFLCALEIYLLLSDSSLLWFMGVVLLVVIAIVFVAISEYKDEKKENSCHVDNEHSIFIKQRQRLKIRYGKAMYKPRNN